MDERFSEACAYVLTFGKHDGKTLARIGSNDEGLLYLDFLRGGLDYRPDVKAMINIYLNHPSNAMKLDSLLDDD